MKSHDPLIMIVLSNHFPLHQGSSLAMGSVWLQTLNCTSLLTPINLFFTGKTSGSLFILGQQYTCRINSKGQSHQWQLRGSMAAWGHSWGGWVLPPGAQVVVEALL